MRKQPLSSKQHHIACPNCDLLLHSPTLNPNEDAICPRCHTVLYRSKKSLQVSLALVVTTFLLYFPAIYLPFLSIQTTGRSHEISLLSSIIEIANGTNIALAVTVALLVLLLPMLKFLGLLAIVLPLNVGRLPWLGTDWTRWVLKLSAWSMVEVYLMGVIVTLVKLSGIASIEFLTGFAVFVLLMIIDAVISITLPAKRIWQSISEIKQGHYYGKAGNT